MILKLVQVQTTIHLFSDGFGFIYYFVESNPSLVDSAVHLKELKRGETEEELKQTTTLT